MPEWCDMECPDAAFPKDEALDGSGSCRTFLAVYCEKHNEINMRNSPCIDVKQQRTATVSERKSALKKARGNRAESGLKKYRR